MDTAIACVIAVLLDTWLGDPQRAHPLAWFHRWAGWAERRLFGGGGRRQGALIAAVAIGLPVLLFAALGVTARFGLLVDVLLLYLALGVASVAQQALRVAGALERGDLAAARSAAFWMVGEEAQGLDAAGLSAAAVRAVLANGRDAAFGPLFWFALGGGAGAAFYRLTDSLDRQWAAGGERYREVGRLLAGLARLLRWPAAHLAALTYGLLGDGPAAWRNWRMGEGGAGQRDYGRLVAAGAAAIGVRADALGEGADAAPRHIRRAVQLVQHGLWFWTVVIVALELLVW